MVSWLRALRVYRDIMSVIQLEDISIDPGAPMPKVLSSDTELYLIFYPATEDENISDIPIARNSIGDKGVCIVRFRQALSHKFGSPSDETLMGHPLYKEGLAPYTAQYLDKSPWIEELVKTDSIHPYHTPSKFKEYKHYILSFHDNTFECVAQGYDMRYQNKDLYDVAVSVLQELVVKDI